MELMRKFFLILTALLIALLSGLSFILFKAEEQINDSGYQVEKRIISLQEVRWLNLSHSSRPIDSLALKLWTFPPKIIIDGVTISELTISSAEDSMAKSPSFIPLQIEIQNLNIKIDAFPYLNNLHGTLRPKLILKNENTQIIRDDDNWFLEGSIPFEHPNLSTLIQFKLQDKKIDLILEEPILKHDLLERMYQFPDMSWQGTLSSEEFTLQSQWQESTFSLRIIPNKMDIKASSLHLESQVDFENILEWLELKKQLRPNNFSAKGSLQLNLDWKDNALKQIHFDVQDLDIIGEVFPVQQMRQIGISYYPIHAQTSRFLGNRSADWVPYSKLGWLKEAVIAAEDSQFNSHKGLNLKGINEALNKSQLDSFSSGGSSITQQLAKNIFLNNKKSLERKLLELIYTISLEKNFSKESILTFYLNAIEFGPNIYGLKQASSHYFLKSPQNLTIREATFLAAILPNPLDGYKKAQLDQVPKYKIDQIIQNIFNGKNISKKQLYTAKAEELRLLIPQE